MCGYPPSSRHTDVGLPQPVPTTPPPSRLIHNSNGIRRRSFYEWHTCTCDRVWDHHDIVHTRFIDAITRHAGFRPRSSFLTLMWMSHHWNISCSTTFFRKTLKLRRIYQSINQSINQSSFLYIQVRRLQLTIVKWTSRRVLSLVTTKVTFKLIQGHWYSSHSICHTWFPISLPLLFCTIFEISLISQNFKRLRDPDHA